MCTLLDSVSSIIFLRVSIQSYCLLLLGSYIHYTVSETPDTDTDTSFLARSAKLQTGLGLYI